MSWSSGRLFALVCLAAWVAECSGLSVLYWMAYVSVTRGNATTGPGEYGFYGKHSPLDRESGLVVLPNEDPLACTHTTYNVTQTPWIALIRRGNCSYQDKIETAKRHNASAVVIYNIDGTGSEINSMLHPETRDIVTVMIGNEFGRNITSLVRAGEEVFLTIGNAHGFWSTPIWIYIMSFSFFAVTSVTLAYFTILTVKRIHLYMTLRREQRYLKSVAQRAIKKLQVRTLRKGDEEVGSDSHTCAVCIEGYKHGEVVLDLTCSHFFHKPCIEPWLLEHRTCPMCKCNILGVKTVDEEVSSGATPSPLDVRFYPESRPGALFDTLEEVSLSDPEENTPPAQETWQGLSLDGPKPWPHQDKDQFHDNPAFEGDSNHMDLK